VAVCRLIFSIDGRSQSFGGCKMKFTQRFDLVRLRLQTNSRAAIDQISCKNGDWSEKKCFVNQFESKWNRK
jgi:hypothetical protein